MSRKRLITSSANGHRWWIAAGWRTVGRQTPAGGIHSNRPVPVPYSAMASPRAYLTIASFLDSSDIHPRIGATEQHSRAVGTAWLPAKAHEIPALHPGRTDAWSNRACGSPGRQPPLQGCQRGTDAPDDSTGGSWGEVFTMEDAFGGGVRSSAEVVPYLPSTMGDDGTHDIPRGSGAGAFAAPGVFLGTWSGRWN
jgi:hypothetical protein